MELIKTKKNNSKHNNPKSHSFAYHNSISMTNRTAEYYNSLSGGGGINSTTFSTHSSTSTTTLTSVFGRNQNNPQNNPQNNQQSQITPQILTAPTSTLFPPQSTQTLTNSLSIYLQDMSRMRKRMIRENNVVQIQHTQRANTPLFPPNNTKPFTQTLQTGRLSSLLTQDYLSNAFLDPNSTTKTWLGIYQLKMKQFKHLNLYDLDLRGLVPNPLKLQAQLFRMALEVNHVKNEFHFGDGPTPHQAWIARSDLPTAQQESVSVTP